MSVYSAYAVDADAQNNGIWVSMRADTEFRIRADASDKVKSWSLRRAKSQRQLIIANEGILPAHITEKNEVDLCVEAVIVDWKNVSGPDGTLIPYSAAAARKLMTDLPTLRRDILLVSGTEAAYRAEVDELGKTSAVPSEPSSNSDPTPTA
jgi:hypothetical protein